MTSTVAGTILTNLEDLSSRLASIREGDRAAIHDGRVATRRLRAALPLLGSGRNREEATTALGIVRALGRALGRARDKDEALALLDEIERRSPDTAPATASLRGRLLPEQLRQRRRLIKTLESLDFAVLGQLHTTLKRETRFGHAPWGQSTRSRVAAAVGERAAAVQKKIDHASGVYFPNRAHHARVAIKKLRYATELIDPGEALRKPAMRALKKAQEILGHVHDREMLLRRLTVHAEEEELPAGRELARVLEAEARALFEEYRPLRPAVVATCDSLAAWSRRTPGLSLGPLFVAGAVALPSAALFLASRARRAG